MIRIYCDICGAYKDDTRTFVDLKAWNFSVSGLGAATPRCQRIDICQACVLKYAPQDDDRSHP